LHKFHTYYTEKSD